MTRTLVIGYGNIDRNDDGVAYAVIAALRLRLGQQGREDAVAKHSWEGYVARLEQVYEDALRARSLRNA